MFPGIGYVDFSDVIHAGSGVHTWQGRKVLSWRPAWASKPVQISESKIKKHLYQHNKNKPIATTPPHKKPNKSQTTF